MHIASGQKLSRRALAVLSPGITLTIAGFENGEHRIRSIMKHKAVVCLYLFVSASHFWKSLFAHYFLLLFLEIEMYSYCSVLSDTWVEGQGEPLLPIFLFSVYSFFADFLLSSKHFLCCSMTKSLSVFGWTYLSVNCHFSSLLNHCNEEAF